MPHSGIALLLCHFLVNGLCLTAGAWIGCAHNLYRWCIWSFPCWTCGGNVDEFAHMIFILKWFLKIATSLSVSFSLSHTHTHTNLNTQHRHITLYICTFVVRRGIVFFCSFYYIHAITVFLSVFLLFSKFFCRFDKLLRDKKTYLLVTWLSFSYRS